MLIVSRLFYIDQSSSAFAFLAVSKFGFNAELSPLLPPEPVRALSSGMVNLHAVV